MEPHTFNDLKEEIQRSSRRKIFPLIAIILFLLGGAIATSVYLYRDTTTHIASKENALTPQDSHNTTSQPKATSNQPTKQPPAAAIESEPSATPTDNPKTLPTTSARTFDKTAFTTIGHSVASRYAQIVELVTFDSATPHEQRVSAIQRAYALDKQYFGETTKLRGLTLQANSVPDKYASLVDLAEDGVSSISIGIDEMHRWSTGSSTGSIEASSARVGRGAALLLEFSQQL